MRILNNYKNIIFLIFGIVFFQTAYSQENFLPGSITTKEGIKVEGFIDYRNWKISPDYILFRENLDSEKKPFSPSEIANFIVADEIYRSAKVEIETSSLSKQHITFNPNLKLESKNVFLQAIIEGTKSLYYYRSPEGRDQFYIKENGKYNLLIYKVYYKEIEVGVKKELTNNKFIGQLILYFSETPSIRPKLQSLKYTKRSLENIFNVYYQTSLSSIKFQKKTEKIASEGGLIIGIVNTGIDFTGSFFPHIIDAEFETSNNISFGLTYDFIMPRNNKRWSFVNELLFTSFSLNGLNNDVKSKDVFTRTKSQFNYSYISLNNILRYNIHSGKNKVFVNLGFSNGIILSGSNKQEKYHKSYSFIYNEGGEALDEIRKNEFGFIYGIGVRKDFFSIELRNKNSTGVSDDRNLGSHIRRTYLLIGIKF